MSDLRVGQRSWFIMPITPNAGAVCHSRWQADKVTSYSLCWLFVANSMLDSSAYEFTSNIGHCAQCKETHHVRVFHRMVAGRAGACAADFPADLMAKNPAAGAEPRRDHPEKGQTLPSRQGQREPRLPHERDESSDSHPGTKDKRVEQAARDLAAGQQDTGRTPVVTDLARKEFPSPVEKKLPPDNRRG